MSLDLSSPDGNLRGFLKARASLDGQDTVTWFTGNVHAWIPGGKHTHVFGFEGYNISRVIEAEGGYDLLTREAVFYLDPQSGDILEKWANPFIGEEVGVTHVWNDPVNQPLRLEGPRGPFHVPVTGTGDDVYFNLDIFLAYPSPLPRSEFPENSQDDLYQAVELFQFYANRSEVEDESVLSADSKVSWTRIAPWLPWMRMADRAGQLVYHCRGSKLPGGYQDLPSWIRDYVEANDAKFSAAPTEFTQPNETSWSYFRKQLERT